ncbi:MAG: hypothetical protein R6V59_04540 [Dehalococcoidia bacterium]
MNRKRWVIVTVIVVAAAVLSISLHVVLGNRPPVIASLEARAEWVPPSESTQIVCSASSPGGEELSYDWWVSGGEIQGRGATVTWTAPDEEGEYRIEVTVTDGRGGQDTHHITIRVKDNRPPVISSLTADAEWSFPAGILEVTCQAYDPDGDELRYGWSATGGDIDGAGAAVNWTGPEEFGEYHITVVVDDGYGGSVTETLSVKVMPDQAPEILDLVITKDRWDHCYLIDDRWGIRVGQGKKFDIECFVSDTVPGTSMERFYELFYQWEWDGGEVSEVSGDGSMLTWIAPNTSVDVTVTVTVSDIAGNMASESRTLRVVGCSVCVFGRQC